MTNHNIFLKHVLCLNISQLVFFFCLCVIFWDKHGVPLSSKHNLGQTAHEHSSGNQIYQIPNIPQLSMSIDCRPAHSYLQGLQI